MPNHPCFDADGKPIPERVKQFMAEFRAAGAKTGRTVQLTAFLCRMLEAEEEILAEEAKARGEDSSALTKD